MVSFSFSNGVVVKRVAGLKFYAGFNCTVGQPKGRAANLYCVVLSERHACFSYAQRWGVFFSLKPESALEECWSSGHVAALTLFMDNLSHTLIWPCRRINECECARNQPNVPRGGLVECGCSYFCWYPMHVFIVHNFIFLFTLVRFHG